MAKAGRKRKAGKRKTPIAHQPGELPTPEQIMKGEAVREFVTHADTATKAMAHRVVHDPVEKWIRKGKLNTTQQNTIARMQEAWDVAYGRAKTTGSYSEPSGGQPGNEQGLRAQERVLILTEAVRAIEDEFSGVRAWYSEFERICRFGEHPMEASGNRDRALTVVRFIADVIAAKRLI